MSQGPRGFTLVELIIVVALVGIIAMLIYPPYRSSIRFFDLSATKTSFQQNARIAMKKMVSELEGGMVVDMKNELDTNGADWIPGNSDDGNDNTGTDEKEDRYNESAPYFIIFYLPNESNPESPGDEVALYAALPDNYTTPIDPALTSEGATPLVYIRRYKYNDEKWEDPPEPLIHQEENLKVTQLCFILGGDNEDRVLITLELAQKGPGPNDEWRTYKLVSTAKLGAR